MLLFSAEVGRNLSPLFRIPLDYGIAERVGLKPLLGTEDNLKEMFSVGCALQLCLAFPLAHPKDGVV